MPTLADLLAGIDSVVTPGKRRLMDLMRNPLAYTQQAFGNVGDNMAQFSQNALRAQEGQDLTRMGSVMGNAPQYRNALTQTTNSLMGMAPIGATVWHGSPHKFDKFDASKIGTGEGAQAYGHGIYTAGNPKVAQEYQKMSPTVDPPPVRTFRGAELDPGTPQYHAARLAEEMSLPQARKTVAGWLANPDPRMTKEAEGWAQTLEVLNQAQSKSDFKRLKNTGNLYKVDLPDDQIAKMLDWDKPLKKQPANVQDAIKARLKELGYSPNANGLRAYHMEHGGFADSTGETLARKFFGDTPEAGAEFMKNQGIPGIRYLDGGSRGAGQGTSNYVVFPGNEGLLNILERNGQPIK